MNQKPIGQVWINPWKYWAVTANLNVEQADLLLGEVLRCAEAGDTEALKRFDFVTLENPVYAWQERRKKKRSESERTVA